MSSRVNSYNSFSSSKNFDKFKLKSFSVCENPGHNIDIGENNKKLTHQNIFKNILDTQNLKKKVLLTQKTYYSNLKGNIFEKNTENLNVNIFRKNVRIKEKKEKNLFFSNEFKTFKTSYTPYKKNNLKILIYKKKQIEIYLRKMDKYMQIELNNKKSLIKYKENISSIILIHHLKNREIEEILKNIRLKYKRCLKISKMYKSIFLNSKFRLLESQNIYLKNINKIKNNKLTDIQKNTYFKFEKLQKFFNNISKKIYKNKLENKDLLNRISFINKNNFKNEKKINLDLEMQINVICILQTIFFIDENYKEIFSIKLIILLKSIKVFKNKFNYDFIKLKNLIKKKKEFFNQKQFLKLFKFIPDININNKKRNGILLQRIKLKKLTNPDQILNIYKIKNPENKKIRSITAKKKNTFFHKKKPNKINRANSKDNSKTKRYFSKENKNSKNKKNSRIKSFSKNRLKSKIPLNQAKSSKTKNTLIYQFFINQKIIELFHIEIKNKKINPFEILLNEYYKKYLLVDETLRTYEYLKFYVKLKKTHLEKLKKQMNLRDKKKFLENENFNNVMKNKFECDLEKLSLRNNKMIFMKNKIYFFFMKIFCLCNSLENSKRNNNYFKFLKKLIPDGKLAKICNFDYPCNYFEGNWIICQEIIEKKKNKFFVKNQKINIKNKIDLKLYVKSLNPSNERIFKFFFTKFIKSFFEISYLTNFQKEKALDFSEATNIVFNSFCKKIFFSLSSYTSKLLYIYNKKIFYKNLNKNNLFKNQLENIFEKLCKKKVLNYSRNKFKKCIPLNCLDIKKARKSLKQKLILKENQDDNLISKKTYLKDTRQDNNYIRRELEHLFKIKKKSFSLIKKKKRIKTFSKSFNKCFNRKDEIYQKFNKNFKILLKLEEEQQKICKNKKLKLTNNFFKIKKKKKIGLMGKN